MRCWFLCIHQILPHLLLLGDHCHHSLHHLHLQHHYRQSILSSHHTSTQPPSHKSNILLWIQHQVVILATLFLHYFQLHNRIGFLMIMNFFLRMAAKEIFHIFSCWFQMISPNPFRGIIELMLLGSYQQLMRPWMISSITNKIETLLNSNSFILFVVVLPDTFAPNACLIS